MFARSARVVALYGSGPIRLRARPAPPPILIKRYLREKFENKCCLCGWSQRNQKTGQIPLVADHIDGNWRNNAEANLRLLCPNCDAIGPTFAGLNRGNGRKNRVISVRAKEGRILVKGSKGLKP